MSHFTTLRTKVSDQAILVNTLKDLGLEVKQDADVRGYNGLKLRADIVATLEGDYDLGWTREEDGTYSLVADLWGVAKKHDQTELLNSINQKYAVNHTLSDVKQRQGLKNANVNVQLALV